MMHERLILFTRYPEPGTAKTRLIAHLGAEGAAQCQKEMTEYTVKQARKAGVSIEIRYTGGSLEQMQDWLGDDLAYADQGAGDLGERMQRAFVVQFNTGVERVVVIGSDCPSNDWKNIQEAFRALEKRDCVIGPAGDGGYYLIGFCRAGAMSPPSRSKTSATFLMEILGNIDWGSEQVLEQTLRASSDLSVSHLKQLDDVDLPEHIPPTISVIIPTLNEKEHIARTLEKVREGFNMEVLVVDGGSTDGTQALVTDCLQCSKGRAAQLNTGAKAATGDILLFLHADTLLPEGWDWIVRDTLSDPSVSLGAFSFQVEEPFRGQWFVEAATNYRSNCWHMPYGDQGLFVRRNTFGQAGGFPDLPIMEDYAFVRSLRRSGRIVTVPQAAITSGRRWIQHGVFKVTLINQLMLLGYHLGISPERLAQYYRGGKGGAR